MIIFKRLRYKNFLSSGNAWTEITLNSRKSTLVVGENGAGKSTILDALCFALYGKGFRKINKSGLVNSINKKGTLVEVEFETRGHEYLVRRGISPNIFEIHRDGSMIDQPDSVAQYQKDLERNVLKMNMKTLTQIVILGNASFVPFMQLTAAHRREVIEDLLDLEVFSNMQAELKAEIAEINTKVKNTEHKIEVLNSKIESAKKHNDSLKVMKNEEVSRIKKSAMQEMESMDKEKASLKRYRERVSELKEKTAQLEKCTNDLNELYYDISKLKERISNHRKEASFYDDKDNCPTCQQDIDQEFKATKIVHLNTLIKHDLNEIKEIEEVASELDIRKGDMEVYAKELTNVKSNISTSLGKIDIHKRNLTRLKSDLTRTTKEAEEVPQDEIESLLDEKKKHSTRLNHLSAMQDIQKISTVILKDNGVKSQMVKKYVPVMNKLINQFLASMDFFVNFELDENFKETIKSRHRDEFSYTSFSEGEKARIDLALLLTWRSISKMRNSVATNLLIMDEVFDGSLDSEGAINLVQILNVLMEDTNIFCISHKGDTWQESFEETLKFKKVKNFSVMEV